MNPDRTRDATGFTVNNGVKNLTDDLVEGEREMKKYGGCDCPCETGLLKGAFILDSQRGNATRVNDANGLTDVTSNLWMRFETDRNSN